MAAALQHRVQDRLDPDLAQSFTVSRTPSESLDAAQAYLEGVGIVAPSLRGRMERLDGSLAIHHGRIRTMVTARPEAKGTRVEVRRVGQAPLQDTRHWILMLGLGGFLIAWGLTFYNERAAQALPPLFTISLFLLGVVLILAVLFVADRSLERRSESIILSLQDAIEGDPLHVLRREVAALAKSSSLANGLIFYCGALVVEFLVFVIVLSDGIRQGIDEAAALGALRFGFLIPIAPALAFAAVYYAVVHRRHRARLEEARRRAVLLVNSTGSMA